MDILTLEGENITSFITPLKCEIFAYEKWVTVPQEWDLGWCVFPVGQNGKYVLLLVQKHLT